LNGHAISAKPALFPECIKQLRVTREDMNPADPDDRISVQEDTVRAHARFPISGQEYCRLFAVRTIFLGAISVQ